MSPEVTRRCMQALFAGAGILHFLKPDPFDSIVPKGIPARPATYTSGAAELAIAAGLQNPHTRRIASKAAMLLLVAVFPANVEMARQWSSKTPLMRAIAFARLPLQGILIKAAAVAGR